MRAVYKFQRLHQRSLNHNRQARRVWSKFTLISATAAAAAALVMKPHHLLGYRYIDATSILYRPIGYIIYINNNQWWTVLHIVNHKAAELIINC